jgi:hypothetical protein
VDPDDLAKDFWSLDDLRGPYRHVIAGDPQPLRERRAGDRCPTLGISVPEIGELERIWQL